VIAIAKLRAWREKDQTWLREAFRTGVPKASAITIFLGGERPEAAPAPEELLRRLGLATVSGR